MSNLEEALSVTGLLMQLHHHFGTNCRVKYGMRTILSVLSLNERHFYLEQLTL